jgi:hypothetical protein
VSMLFNFLRQFLIDEEFEQTKYELAETKAVLEEYKKFIQEQRIQESQAKEKVDPDFLVFVWATVGFAFLIFSEAAKKSIELQDERPLTLYFWIILAVFAFFFIIKNALFALELTSIYAKSKSNPDYLSFARYIIAGAALMVITVLITAFLN